MEKKRITDLVFIVDASGSMTPLRQTTIDGFNKMLRAQRAESCEDEAYVTLSVFNKKNDVRFIRNGMDAVAELTSEDYLPGGLTALNDAIGETMMLLEEAQKEDVAAGREVHTLVVIITDGMENASRKYSRLHVRDLIRIKKELGWQFVFLGSDIDVEQEGADLGLERDVTLSFTHDDAGVSHMMERVSACCKCFRMAEDVRFGVRTKG